MPRPTPTPATPGTADPCPPPPAVAVDPADRLDGDALEALARRLLAPDAVDGVAEPDVPVLVLVTPTATHLDIALRPAGGDPAVALRGLTAPPGCRAAGVIAPAHLRPVPDGLDVAAPWPRRTDDGTEGRSARVALLVDATGRVAWAHTDERGVDGVRSWRSEPDEPRHGRLYDAGLRVHGLPTPPPPTDTAALWTALWLERLAADPPASWGEARRRHPAAAVLPELAGTDQAPDDALVEATEVLAQLWPWDGLRRALARGGHDLAGVTPADAAWFDAGSFARAVLEGVAAPSGTLAALERTVPPEVHHHVARVAAAATEGGTGGAPPG